MVNRSMNSHFQSLSLLGYGFITIFSFIHFLAHFLGLQKEEKNELQAYSLINFLFSFVTTIFSVLKACNSYANASEKSFPFHISLSVTD